MMLKADWTAWEKARRRELQAVGFARAEAKGIARRESARRKRLAHICGEHAAMKGDEVTTFFADGRYRISLAIDLSELPEPFLSRSRAWASDGIRTAQ